MHSSVFRDPLFISGRASGDPHVHFECLLHALSHPYLYVIINHAWISQLQHCPRLSLPPPPFSSPRTAGLDSFAKVLFGNKKFFQDVFQWAVEHLQRSAPIFLSLQASNSIYFLWSIIMPEEVTLLIWGSRFSETLLLNLPRWKSFFLMIILIWLLKKKPSCVASFLHW